MNKLKKKIKNNYRQLTSAYKLISNTILQYENQNFSLNISELATQSYCSNSTIIKYINYFGYNSYKVFQAALNTPDETTFNNFFHSFQLVEDYFLKYSKILEKFFEEINRSTNVYFFAAGQSQLSAIDFSLKCNKIVPNKFIFESNIATQELLISTISPDDLVIFISNSGEARELLSFSSKITNDIILVTNREHSKLALKASTIICLQNNFESPLTFRDFSMESKYTLVYFFDKVFGILYGEMI